MKSKSTKIRNNTKRPNGFTPKPEHVDAVRRALADYPHVTYEVIGKMCGISGPYAGNIARLVLGASHRPKGKKKAQRAARQEAIARVLEKASGIPTGTSEAPAGNVVPSGVTAPDSAAPMPYALGLMRAIYTLGAGRKIDTTDLLAELEAERDMRAVATESMRAFANSITERTTTFGLAELATAYVNGGAP